MLVGDSDFQGSYMTLKQELEIKEQIRKMYKMISQKKTQIEQQAKKNIDAS